MSGESSPTAAAEAERAIALDPNDAESYAVLAQTLNFAGRPEKAIELLEKAVRLNPRYPALYSVYFGYAYYLTGRNEEAITAFQRALAQIPDFAPGHLHLAALYSELGRETEAQAEGAEVLRLSPNFSLEIWKQRVPYKDPAVVERYAAALRKAGLK